MAAAAKEEEQELNPSSPNCMHLLSAILSMEPSDCVLSHARVCGGGSIAEPVQKFIWDYCLSSPCDCHAPYLKNLLKKLTSEVELDHGYVLDHLMIVLPKKIEGSAKEFSFFFLMIGSGVGLVGLCLAHLKASKVILSDGDISTLANLKLNLELNHLNVETDMLQKNEDPSMVKCMYLPWESASESQLQDIMPDVVCDI